MADKIDAARLDADMLANAATDEFLEYLRTSKDVASARVQIPDDATSDEIADMIISQAAFNATARMKRT